MSKTELNSKWFFENLIPNLLTAFGDRMTGIAEIYGFDIAGDGGGQFVVDLTPEGVGVRAGDLDKAGCTLVMTDSDFMDLVNGKLNGMAAFMSGQISVKGDMNKLMKLSELKGAFKPQA